ncbi:Vitamin B12 ABC transporter, B12-binding protein component BtuF [Roseibacterium elongatum DSM 19469]|uniref:Vitamin B12 ABC transporter, B12-binding protein component BtuF n=1 Tax=Roseicyclus elongatus DSM 19469 TaxID=1294273 RepID=W8RZY1_9RHOB|nr:ABC transporter substrate-binding protein [Roseibacterium elongatum]AHM03402.1 Vitamin B12 ABC transporter, B12-binding protein component BtuF [Roseibacterium elongatum DSM 19469]
MNLCTDQFAMLLAAPGQLISVSAIATDPLISPMSDRAAGYPRNHGGAEEIYLLNPDLVLAGVYSDPATVAMLRNLGIRVEQIQVAQSLIDIPDRLREVAGHLDQMDRAESLIATFETNLARLTAEPGGPRAAFYYPNGYTVGTETLSHDILTTAGFTHIADELGRSASGRLALELLAIAQPDLVIGSTPYAGASRSEEILRHPALQALIAAGRGTVSGPDWVCGTPHVIDALVDLTVIRRAMEGGE